MIDRYKTSQAFRTALETRLREIAHSRGTDLQRLRRRVAFERLLARLFSQVDPPWLLKGGYALELRLQERARSTLDLDLTIPELDRLRLMMGADRETPSSELVHEYLQQAAAADQGDYFQFLIQQPRVMPAGAPKGGIRYSVESRLAGRIFARFRLDVGLGDVVLDQPDWVDGSDLLEFAGVPAVRVALYPLTQQFAEKIHAYTFPWRDRVSTRVKDLADLVLLVDSGELDPERSSKALKATFEIRNTHELPYRLPQPPVEWTDSYAALARELGLSASNLHEAHSQLDRVWQRWGLDQADASSEASTIP